MARARQSAGYLRPVQQSDSTRYLGLCVYGSVGFGLHHTPPVFFILFTKQRLQLTPTIRHPFNFLGLSQW